MAPPHPASPSSPPLLYTLSAGAADSTENVRAFMAECTRSRLHLVLCCSPTRSLLAEWVQQFPSLVAACQVDWFMPWPTDALLEVAARFLAERGVGPQDSPRLGQSMAAIHDLIATQCQVEELERRSWEGMRLCEMDWHEARIFTKR